MRTLSSHLPIGTQAGPMMARSKSVCCSASAINVRKFTPSGMLSMSINTDCAPKWLARRSRILPVMASTVLTSNRKSRSSASPNISGVRRCGRTRKRRWLYLRNEGQQGQHPFLDERYNDDLQADFRKQLFLAQSISLSSGEEEASGWNGRRMIILYDFGNSVCVPEGAHHAAREGQTWQAIKSTTCSAASNTTRAISSLIPRA